MAYADESVRQLLRREGVRRVSGRPEHPRGDAAGRSAFRSEFAVRVRGRVQEILGSSALSQPVEAWFQDEARVGQSMMPRLWARRGSRPRIVRDNRCGYLYLFSAACGSRGKAVGLVSERANTAAMNAHPAAIGAAVAPGSVGVVALDGAGWHRSRTLALPDNIVLLTLPPTVPSSIRWRWCFSIRGKPSDEPGVRECRGGSRGVSRGLGVVRRRSEPHRLHHASRVGNRPRPCP